MEKIANPGLPISPTLDRVELAAAIDDLADAVRHLARVALRAKLKVAIDNATQVGRAAEAVRAAAWVTEKVESQSRVEGATIDENATSIVPMTEDLPLDRYNSCLLYTSDA